MNRRRICALIMLVELAAVLLGAHAISYALADEQAGDSPLCSARRSFLTPGHDFCGAASQAVGEPHLFRPLLPLYACFAAPDAVNTLATMERIE